MRKHVINQWMETGSFRQTPLLWLKLRDCSTKTKFFFVCFVWAESSQSHLAFFCWAVAAVPSGGAYVTQNYQCQVGDQCLDFIQGVVIATISKEVNKSWNNVLRLVPNIFVDFDSWNSGVWFFLPIIPWVFVRFCKTVIQPVDVRWFWMC